MDNNWTIWIVLVWLAQLRWIFHIAIRVLGCRKQSLAKMSIKTLKQKREKTPTFCVLACHVQAVRTYFCHIHLAGCTMYSTYGLCETESFHQRWDEVNVHQLNENCKFIFPQMDRLHPFIVVQMSNGVLPKRDAFLLMPE